MITALQCNKCQFLPLCLHKNDQGFCSSIDSLLVKKTIKLKKGDTLFTPNTPIQFLYVIKTGAVKTVQSEPDGSELIRNFYFKGEMFGYKAIYNGKYQSSAKALTDSVICAIDYNELLQFAGHHPPSQSHLMYLASFQINLGSYLICNSAERRVAGFLLDISKRLHQANQTKSFRLPMKHQDIANYLRLTAETFSRIMTKLIKNKIINTDKRIVTLTNAAALQKIADNI